MDNCNKCNKEKNHCGCTKIDAKCVIYKGECLENLNFCSPKDLEEIIKIIDAVIGEIYLSIDKFFIGLNVGLGAEVYKGKSILGFEEFKTLTSNISINIEETENTLNFSIDEEWLTDFITNIVLDYTTNIESQDNSLIVDNISNPKNIELNPNVFNSPSGSINITSTTTGGGDRRINFNVNEQFIENIVISLLPTIPTLVNVGGGTSVYAGTNLAGNHQIRSIKASSTGANVNVSTDSDNSILIQIDVPTEDFGVPSYYVNPLYTGAVEDGSIIRPFKTWSACRTAIIGSGTFWNPQNLGVRVIFQASTTSSQDLTIRNITYQFDNNTTFTYTGLASYVIDQQLIVTNVPKTTGVVNAGFGSYITLTGEGSITSSGTTAPVKLIRSVGYGVNGQGNQEKFLIIIEGDISLVEKNPLMSNFDLTNNGSGSPYLTDSGLPIYVLRQSSGVDVVPIDKGLLTVEGKNHLIRESLYIRPTGFLTLISTINRALFVDTEASLLCEGNIFVTQREDMVRYGNNIANYYTPSNTHSIISIKGGGTVQFSEPGQLFTKTLGNQSQGGWNSIIELEGLNSSFYHNSSAPLSINTRVYANHLLYILDNTTKYVEISNIDCILNPYISIFGGAPSITGSNTILSISQGRLEQDLDLVTKPIFSSGLTALTIQSNLLFLKLRLYKTYWDVHATNADALAAGLLEGMLFLTNTAGEYNVKVVQ